MTPQRAALDRAITWWYQVGSPRRHVQIAILVAIATIVHIIAILRRWYNANMGENILEFMKFAQILFLQPMAVVCEWV